MEFLLTKTSNEWDEDGNMLPPHQDARSRKYDRIEVRTLNSEAEFDERFGALEGKWRSKGVDHTKTPQGHIQRRHPLDSEGYFIRLQSLDDLVTFVKENGSVVMQENGGVMEIEIYNGYRE